MARKCFYHPCFQWKPHLGAAYIKGRFLLEDGFYKEYATVGAASITGRFCISGRIRGNTVCNGHETYTIGRLSYEVSDCIIF